MPDLLAQKLLNNPDSENRYLFATDMAFCGEKACV